VERETRDEGSDAVVQVPAQPSSLLLARGDDELAGSPRLASECRGMHRDGGLARESVDPRAFAPRAIASTEDERPDDRPAVSKRHALGVAERSRADSLAVGELDGDLGVSQQGGEPGDGFRYEPVGELRGVPRGLESFAEPSERRRGVIDFAVDEAIDPARQSRMQREQDERDDRGRDRRGARERAERRHDHRVERDDDGGQDAVAQRRRYRYVDVPQPVPQDGDRDRDRHGKDREPDEEPAERLRDEHARDEHDECGARPPGRAT